MTDPDTGSPVKPTDNPSPAELDELKIALVADNAKVLPFEMQRPVAAFIRSGGELTAGVSGYTYWGWLVVERLWVSESIRGSGMGSRLLRAAENEARDRACHGAWLDTFSFQVKPFYETHGYRQFGELTDYPPGFQRHFLWKSLLEKQA